MSLVYYDRWFGRQRSKTMLGPGAASAAEFEPLVGGGPVARALARAPDRDGHRAAQLLRGARDRPVRGAGPGDARARAHHRASACTTRPRASASSRRSPAPTTRPSLEVPRLLGLIGGGPTFVGTLLGHVWVNETVSVAFLALAAGSILYVVIQLMNVNQKLGYKSSSPGCCSRGCSSASRPTSSSKPPESSTPRR